MSYRDDWSAAVQDFSDGHGVDVILDSIGAKYLGRHLDLLAMGGRLMVIGLQGGRQAELDLGQLLAKRGRLIATTVRSRTVQEKADMCAEVARSVWPLVSAGEIMPAPQTVLGLDQAAEAHRQLESGANLGKIILRVP